MNKQAFVRQKVVERKVKWSIHALKELAREPLSVMAVEVALQQAIVIEDYAQIHRFLPDCLILAFDDSGQPIHCVIAVNEPCDYVLIVTMYRPSGEEWKDDWRTRK